MPIVKNQTNIAHILFDKNLSYKEIGILMTLFYLPDGCSVSIEFLSSIHKDGRDSITRAISNLIEKGYVYKERIYLNKDGHLVPEMLYKVYFDPINNNHFIEKQLNEQQT